MFTLKGNQHELRRQIDVLNTFDIQVIDGCLEKDNLKLALTFIWLFKISGFWFYQKELLALGLCTNNEFQEAIIKKGEMEEKKERKEICPFCGSEIKLVPSGNGFGAELKPKCKCPPLAKVSGKVGFGNQ